MAAVTNAFQPIPWWKEPTKEQWHAWVAAWLGWTLDAFDFTIFLLIMLPIAQEFHVPLTAVTAVFTITLWMRLVGATGSGWLADRIGRKTPLMISIAWYSACNFIAGFSPAFWFLFLFRALLGIGMGAEWPVGAALAMETWPQRSRGFMAGVLQSSWGLGALLSSAAYGLLYNSIGWRGLLMLGVLPALLILYVRHFVKEPEVWLENRRLQRTQRREVRIPLLKIFKRGMLANTMTACWWMASGFVTGYSIGTLFPTHLQRDLHLSPGLVALPIMLQSIFFFLSGSAWGWVSDRIGRRWAMILPALLGIPITPLYLFTHNYTMIVIFFGVQGLFAAGGIYGQNASYLSERFPTEVRATASGFCYHQGAIFGGLMGPIIAYFALNWHLGFAVPMLIGTLLGLISFIAALLSGPETRGKRLVAELSVA
ncbi:MAG TPA: MFS transporter [Stellaceae bacterium]|jgi:SHS family lactate transporter-like MFS transporter|nr:MFS transporter [Stellaceae bacterium]